MIHPRLKPPETMLRSLQRRSLAKLRQTRLTRFNSTITSQSYIADEYLSEANKQEIAQYLSNLGPFPINSPILNPQHFYQNEILMRYSQQSPHPVSLRQLAGYGKTLTRQKIIDSANFVRLELPIRLALRIRDLQTLPFGVVNNFHLAQVYESYYHSFDIFRKIPKIQSTADNQRFCEKISSMLDDHVFNLPHLMMGALEVLIQNNLGGIDLDSFMGTMLRSRISRRLIIEQHLSLTDIYKTEPYTTKPPDFIGEIFQNCVAVDHLQQVHEKLKVSMGDMVEKELMPDLQIDGDLNTSFPFIVPHLHYLLGEILRNSLVATIKFHGPEIKEKLPPIKVTIVNNKKGLVLRISDQGGGMGINNLEGVWSFAKLPDVSRKSLANFHQIPGLRVNSHIKSQPGELTASEEMFNQTSLMDVTNSPSEKKSTLSNLIERPHQFHLGLGLPMCKVYANYWNGDILMECLEGYGSDTCLTLSKLGYHSNVIQLDKA